MITTGNIYADLVAIIFSLATIGCFATKDAQPYEAAIITSIITGIGVGYCIYLGI